MAQNWLDDCFSNAHTVETDMAQIENNFGCLKSLFSGSSAPANPVSYQLWANSSNSIIYYRGTGSSWEGLYDCANDRIYNQKVDGVSIKTSAILSSNLSATCVKTANIDGVCISSGMFADGDLSINKLSLYTTGSSLIAYASASYAAPSTSWVTAFSIGLGPSGSITAEVNVKYSEGASSGGGWVTLMMNGSTISADFHLLASYGRTTSLSTYIDVVLPTSGNNVISLRMRKGPSLIGSLEGQLRIRCGSGPLVTEVVSTTKGFTFS